MRKLRAGMMPPPGVPPPGCRDGRGAGRVARNARSIGRPRAQPNPGRPLAPPAEPRRIRQRDPRSAGARRRRRRRCCRPTIRATASTTSRTCSASRRCCSSAICRRAEKISALAVGDPSIAAERRDLPRAPATSRRPAHRGAAARHARRRADRPDVPARRRVRSSRSKLLRTNLGVDPRASSIRTSSRSRVDGERVHLATFGGDRGLSQTSLDEPDDDAVTMIDARLHGARAGQGGPARRRRRRSSRRRGGRATPTRCSRSMRSRTIRSTSAGIPHIETCHDQRAVQRDGAGDTPSRRRIFVCRPASAADEAPCAQHGFCRAGAPRLSPAGRPTPTRGAAGVLRARPRASGHASTAASSWRSSALLAEPEVRVPRRARSGDRRRPATAYRVSDLELASRLSFFLWSSIPDDELLDAGGRGAAQGSRRCSSSRCGGCWRTRARRRSSSNFAGQWLQSAQPAERRCPSTDEFPDFDDNLRQAFRRETELFFDSIVREDRSVLELLTADYTFVNERLARHYGIPNIYGSRFRRVTLADEARQGLLGQGQHPDGDVARRPDVAGAARQVDSGEHARHAAAAAAGECAAAQGEQGAQQAADDAGADGRASREPGVRGLPPADGSARLRARELRRRRRVADDATPARRSMRRGSSPTARRWTARWRCAGRSSDGPTRSSRR